MAIPASSSSATALPSGESFTFTVHAVYLPRPRIEISGPQGVQTSFDWQAARDSVLGQNVHRHADQWHRGILSMLHTRTSPVRRILARSRPRRPGAAWRPLTTALMVAARSDPALRELPAGTSDDETAVVFARALAERAILDWEGVGDVEGRPVPVTPDGVVALLDVWPIFERFQLGYVATGVELEAEKNASAPSPSGSTAGAKVTARPAKKRARTARKS